MDMSIVVLNQTVTGCFDLYVAQDLPLNLSPALFP